MNSVSPARQVSRTLQQGFGRRRFLKWTLMGGAGVAAVAAGGFALLRRSALDDQPVPADISGLSHSEYHLFARCQQVLLPTEGTELHPSDSLPVVANVAAILSFMAAPVRKQLGMGLSLFDNAAVFSHGCRFVDLDDDSARRYFDQWGQGAVIQRTLATAIKQLTYTAYWREPATWPAVEFDGPVTDKWGLAYLGNAPLPQEDGEGRV
ncbi:hypothetical protein A11A3_05554 [Alcanivorax hongdengensis A-11-3]|uniref:Gluconate 2-dehydrogenase subunit 3 family protein n=1 Tax=Alcanivorax hongdengensis A-11-3 TaxID=1177179 RepID=L0WE72_9GAMM|nr:hypothetical protein [Alcanivorax hongdengensis]EKF75133.1 hypothetical protein A11A3_05554 [Alcanivorax hongdengensis A-11-3]